MVYRPILTDVECCSVIVDKPSLYFINKTKEVPYREIISPQILKIVELITFFREEGRTLSIERVKTFPSLMMQDDVTRRILSPEEAKTLF